MSLPNTSAGTAIALTLPASVTIDLYDAIGTGAWYSYTPAVISPGFVGAKVLPNLPSDEAQLTAYQGIALASPSQFGTMRIDSTAPMQVPVLLGNTYYWKFESTGAPTLGTPATFTLVAPSKSPAGIGSIVIPDDGHGFPAVVMRQSDGEVIRVVEFPAGEHGDVLPDGTMCVEARNSSAIVDTIQIFSSQFLLIADRPSLIQPGTFFQAIAADGIDTFYIVPVGSAASPPEVRAVSSAGVVSGTVWTLSGVGTTAMAISPGGATLYWSQFGTAAVKRHDMGSDSAVSDLAADVAGSAVAELMALADGSVVVYYEKASTRTDDFLRQYSAAGATLRDYAVGTAYTGFTFNHMARDPDGAASFWTWFSIFTPLPQAMFVQYATVDGSVLQSLTVDIFEHGSGPTGTTQQFGPSQSCPFFFLHQPIPLRLSVPVLSYTPYTTPLRTPTKRGINTQGRRPHAR